MQDLVQQIKRGAITDALTGLHNRHYFNEIAPSLVASTQRRKTTFSVILFDIDHFKRFNDVYGHATGDQVLKTVADLLKKEVRQSDYTFRFGGEEFLLLLPDTDAKRAFIAAEKIRRSVESTKLVSENGESLHVTISGGVAAFSESRGLERTIQAADKALYRAKNAGRNRIETEDEA